MRFPKTYLAVVNIKLSKNLFGSVLSDIEYETDGVEFFNRDGFASVFVQ